MNGGDGEVEDDDAYPDAFPGEAPEETEWRLNAAKKPEEPSDMRHVTKFMASMELVLEVSS